MKALAAALAGELARGNAPLAALESLGAPDPVRTARALEKAATHPELAPVLGRWLEPLLASADPGRGAEHLVDLADRHRGRVSAPLPEAALRGLAALVGSSEALARVLRRHPHWCGELADNPPPASELPDPDWTSVRICKYRGLIRIAARDLCGRAFRESLVELSDLADRCLDAALRKACADAQVPAPALFALGKLGGRELNFSSDVDLLFVFEPDRARDPAAQVTALTRAIRQLKTHLEAPSEDGFGYRVDLDLRPEGTVGALVNSVDAALDYYEAYGAEWERQMLIRLRRVCGDPVAAEAFATGVTPFVYRRAIDTQAIGAVRAMKQRIESERRAAGRDLEADLKEGPGGIRDVEFLVQALQLFFGASQPDLRTGNAIEALATLGRSGGLPEAVAEALVDAYLWLRRAEHCLQLPEERQVRAFPRRAPEQLALARRMGYADPEASVARDRLLDDWTRVRAEVRGHFDALVLEDRHG